MEEIAACEALVRRCLCCPIIAAAAPPPREAREALLEAVLEELRRGAQQSDQNVDTEAEASSSSEVVDVGPPLDELLDAEHALADVEASLAECRAVASTLRSGHVAARSACQARAAT